ncbi:hypothetical protein K474DRAFT_1673492 [Panus rudis PR-1116 ss-1]|nr:hypothetical protein K474DRAFT_1673492 [Panus rudis PR-1116 ss-1]
MATVGPAAPRHPSPFKRASRMPTHQRTSHPSMPDPYYGHEEVAKICARFVKHVFNCPDLPPPSSTNPDAPSPPLALFIAYALHRTRLHQSVTFAALYLLQRLKSRFPACRGSSGHRLFISAFMLASKVMCDDTYSNKSWSIVGQGMFALREINQMEREMCSYLEWQLNVEPEQLKEFEEKVRRDFKGPGPYPTYTVSTPAPSPMPSNTPYGTRQPTNPPSFVSGRAPSTEPPKPAPAPVKAVHPHPLQTAPLPPSSQPTSVYMVNSPMDPGTPDTPEAYRSNSTSPASSNSPPTPPGPEDHNAKVVMPPEHMPIASSEPSSQPHAQSQQQQPPQPPSKTNPGRYVYNGIRQRRSQDEQATTPDPARKPKMDYFAFAVPCSW